MNTEIVVVDFHNDTHMKDIEYLSVRNNFHVDDICLFICDNKDMWPKIAFENMLLHGMDSDMAAKYQVILSIHRFWNNSGWVVN